MKIALVDLETGGLDPYTDEIVEIGCVIFDSDTLEIIDTADIKVKPEFPERMNPKALEVNGYDEALWEDASSLEWALTSFVLQTKGCLFMAHNVTFDWAFMLAASKKTGVPLEFDRHKIDLLSVAWARIPHSKVRSWSLKTICTYLGIEPEPKVHRAANGAMKAYEAYCALLGRKAASVPMDALDRRSVIAGKRI